MDQVETGRAVRENGLRPVEERLAVSQVLVARQAASGSEGDEARVVRRGLGGPE